MFVFGACLVQFLSDAHRNSDRGAPAVFLHRWAGCAGGRAFLMDFLYALIMQ